MSNLKHYRFVPLFTLLLVTACKKSPNTKIEIPENEPPALTKTFIPIKLEASGVIINLKYQEKTTLLTEIHEAGGTKIMITYDTMQHLSTLEKYKDDKLFYITYYKMSDKKIINEVLMLDYKNLQYKYIPKGSYTLTYDNLQQLSAIKYYNNSAQLIDTRIQSYSTSGNLSAVNTINNLGSTNAHTYAFDQKKGIASNIKYTQLLVLESEHWFLNSCVNNILNYRNQKSPSENTDFSYEYNADGYPSIMIISKNQNTQRIKITYKSVEL